MDFRARISSYCNFIEEVTKNEAKCESIFPNNNHNITPKQFPPLYKGQETPIKLFDFVIPFYSYYFGHECTATVISKRYLLTSAFCVHQTNEESRLTQFSTYKTISGNFFPDFRSKSGIHSNIVEPVNVTAYIPLNYDWPWRHNLAVVEFPEGTDFGVEPITLAKDYIQIYLDYAIIAEYGKYEIKTNISLTEGSATLIEKNGKFYQFAVNYLHGTPDGAAANVAGDCNFIQEVTKNEVICESTAPIYEMPFESTTFLPQPNQENNAKSEPLTAAAAPSIIGFQMGF
uniref:Peptidase S1 domain-containing protein n=1 Tax=Panagrolaimus superbus TaxID=310955 RepID=A0A914Z6G6_9BILA